jgi:hypothetical protein
MRENGIECPIANLQRWVKHEFVFRPNARRKPITAKEAKEASASVSKAAKDGEAKALTRLEVLIAEEAEMKARAEELDKIEQDSELARKAMRKSMIAQIILAEQIIRRAAFIVEAAPDIAAKVMDVLKGPTASTTIVIPPTSEDKPAPNGDSAKIIDGRVLEKSPSQMAIEAFKARQRVGAAA